MISKIKRNIKRLNNLLLLESKLNNKFDSLNNELFMQKMLIAKQLVIKIKEFKEIKSFADVEFSVFSQFGDDGIIQYLINNIDITHNTFIEFGVGDYRESNTRFLLMNNNWSGLVADSSEEFINRLKSENLYWRHNLHAINYFITRENINKMIKDNGFKGEIGLLHIDIDGNDYWIWKEIIVVNPIIVILEYNSVFGIKRPITIPYKSDFKRNIAHYSYLYWGSSLLALCLLSDVKGYSFIGSNSAGNNAYFVRKDKLGNLKTLTPQQGYVESQYRESRDKEGKLNYLSKTKRLDAIKGMPVYNMVTGKIERL